MAREHLAAEDVIDTLVRAIGQKINLSPLFVSNARVPLCRLDDRLCVHAGCGLGQRPPALVPDGAQLGPERGYRSSLGGQRFNVALDAPSRLPHGNLEVVTGLQVQPELRRGAEVARQP